MKNHKVFFQRFDGIMSLRRLYQACRMINLIIRTRLKYWSFEKFIQVNADVGFNGKWTKDEERVPENEMDLIKRIHLSFISMKKNQRNADRAYLPSHEWKRLLESEWEKYQEMINQHDFSEISSFLRNFFRNEGISGFWGSTGMFETFTNLRFEHDVYRAELLIQQLEIWKQNVKNVHLNELDSPRIGNPWGYDFEGYLLYEPVFEYDYQSRYFSRLLHQIESPTILEIGGGFGGLAYHILKNNKAITYIGIDLPENIIIQYYYLSCAFPDLKIYCYNDKFKEVNDEIADEYDVILLPNFALPDIHISSVDLIVNVRSLSEMSLETIQEYFEQIDRLDSLFFFHENIFKERLDGLHGIPSFNFPALKNHTLIYSSESRWARYNRMSAYPCRENLFIHNDRIANAD